MHFQVGLSFVVCCHNSAERLPEALAHIFAQEFPEEVPWEVLLIDNASTDETVAIADRMRLRFGMDENRLRLASEERLGIGFARYKGIKEAKYSFICFIDDDNWVEKSYARTAYNFMVSHSDVAACGSLNEAISVQELPDWFTTFQRSYAVGPQSENRGDVTDIRGVIWSAGMVLRKPAVMDLLDAGFEPLVVGARGAKSLMRSEDYELCLALKLRGWRIWYEPALKLQHFMPPQRLDWNYLRKLLRGVGESDPGLLPYYYAKDSCFQVKPGLWLRLCGKTAVQLVSKIRVLLLLKFRRFEGDNDVLLVERWIGLLTGLLMQRAAFDRQVKRVLAATWIVRVSE